MSKQHNEIETYARNVGLDMLTAEDASNRLEYVGFAYPGALSSEAKWQIYKLEYSASGQVSKRRYANNNDKFDEVFDDRASFDYVDIT